MGMTAAAFAGTLLSGTADINVGATNTGNTVQPGSGTPAYYGELIVCGLAPFLSAPGGSFTVDSSFIIAAQAAQTTPALGTALAYLVQTTASAVNPTWSGIGAGNTAAAMMASFQPTAPVGAFMSLLAASNF
jgi:hypothetical protein